MTGRPDLSRRTDGGRGLQLCFEQSPNPRQPEEGAAGASETRFNRRLANAPEADLASA